MLKLIGQDVSLVFNSLQTSEKFLGTEMRKSKTEVSGLGSSWTSERRERVVWGQDSWDVGEGPGSMNLPRLQRPELAHKS